MFRRDVARAEPRSTMPTMAKDAHGDGSARGEDGNPVVQRIPVYFNRTRADGQSLCVLQYPLRPAERPYDIENIEMVRYKPKSNKLEMELPLDNNKQNFDAESAPNLRIERRVLTSTDTPVHDGYCIAVMRDGALHITPVNAVFQMRPSLAHLDAADERRKEQEKVTDTEMVRVHHSGQEDAEQEAMYGAPSDVPSMTTPAAGSAAAAKLMPLQVQVKRRETERQTEMRLHSHAYLKQLEEEERWMQLEPVFQDDDYSARVRAQITTLPHRDEKPGLKGAVPEPPSAGLSIPRSIYLDSLCPITSDQLCGVVGDTEDHFRFPEGNTLSKAQLDGLPLDRRIHALFARGQRTVLRFSRVMHFAPAGCDPKDVISALLPVAHLVQGCWVACSALRCGGNARRERVRDHILLQFSRGNRMQTDVFGRGPPPPPPPGEQGLEKLRKEILSELAVPRISGAGARGGLKGAGEGVNTGEGHEGWSFIEPTDQDFIEAHPEVARREEERWQAISPWLETDPAVAASLAPPPLPADINAAVASKAQDIVLPLILSNGVVRLSTIRTHLERSGVSDLPPLALLREPELLGVLGGNVVSIDGACALLSIGDRALDPFRGFLLKMLRTRGRTVRRTDVMEGAAAALGAAPSNSVYMRCLGDLCVSRGSTWVMKTGA